MSLMLSQFRNTVLKVHMEVTNHKIRNETMSFTDVFGSKRNICEKKVFDI